MNIDVFDIIVNVDSDSYLLFAHLIVTCLSKGNGVDKPWTK